ncbi:MAG: transposase [Bacteroidales bacterium]|jgi:hypothetical protein|nr:transposase [Bacteroidales bacterium]
MNIPDNLDELKMSGKIEYRIIYDGITEDEPYVSDFQLDLKIIPVYIETRRSVGTPPKISYGDNFKILAIYLSVIGLVSVKRMADFFSKITYGMANISKATIAKFINIAAGKVNLTPLIQDLLNGEVLHVDETPIKTTERRSGDDETRNVLPHNAQRLHTNLF